MEIFDGGKVYVLELRVSTAHAVLQLNRPTTLLQHLSNSPSNPIPTLKISILALGNAKKSDAHMHTQGNRVDDLVKNVVWHKNVV